MLYQMFGTLFPICKFSLPKQKYLEFFSYYYSCNNRFQQIIQKAAAIWGSGCFKNAIFSHDFMCLLDKKYHLRAARNKYWPISFLQEMYQSLPFTQVLRGYGIICLFPPIWCFFSPYSQSGARVVGVSLPDKSQLLVFTLADISHCSSCPF